MLDRYRQLNASDRRALLVGGVAVLAAIAWFGMIEPLQGAIDRAAQREAAAAERLSRMEIAQRRVAGLGGMPEVSPRDLPDRVVALLTGNGLAEDAFVVRQVDAHTVELRLARVRFTRLLEILDAMVAVGVTIQAAELSLIESGDSGESVVSAGLEIAAS